MEQVWRERQKFSSGRVSTLDIHVELLSGLEDWTRFRAEVQGTGRDTGVLSIRHLKPWTRGELQEMTVDGKEEALN